MIRAILFVAFARLAGHAAQDAGTQWLEYGRAQIRAHQYSAAAASLTKASLLSPGNPAAFKELGNAYYYAGNLALSKQSYANSLKLNPSDSALKAFLEKLEGVAPAAAARAPAQATPMMEKGNWAVPALMSMALPGVGQLYDGKPVRALVLGVPTIALLVGAATTYALGQDASRRYATSEGSAEDLDEAYSTWQRMTPIFGACAFLGLSMYIWTVVDAAVHVPSRPITAASIPAISLALLPGGIEAKCRLAEF